MSGGGRNGGRRGVGHAADCGDEGVTWGGFSDGCAEAGRGHMAITSVTGTTAALEASHAEHKRHMGRRGPLGKASRARRSWRG
jgi:hypothetical protein